MGMGSRCDRSPPAARLPKARHHGGLGHSENGLLGGIVGFVIGLVARAVMPGAQQMGIIKTTLLGIIGGVVGGLIARLFSKPEPGSAFHPAGFIMSVIGAIIVLFLYTRLAPA